MAVDCDCYFLPALTTPRELVGVPYPSCRSKYSKEYDSIIFSRVHNWKA